MIITTTMMTMMMMIRSRASRVARSTSSYYSPSPSSSSSSCCRSSTSSHASLRSLATVSHEGVSKLVVTTFRAPDHHVSGTFATGSVAKMLATGQSLQACDLLEAHVLRTDRLDFQAIHLLHDVYEFRQSPRQMRDLIPGLLWAWNEEEHPQYTHLLGLHAKGLNARGDFAQAEDVGMKALLIDPCTPLAIEAVAASLVAQGRNREGKRFLQDMDHCYEGPDGDGVAGSYLSPHTLNITCLAAAMDIEQGKRHHVLVHRVATDILRDVPWHEEGAALFAAEDQIAWKHEAAERIRVATAIAARLHCIVPLLRTEDEEGAVTGHEVSMMSRVFGSREADPSAPQLRDLWTGVLDMLESHEARAPSSLLLQGEGDHAVLSSDPILGEGTVADPRRNLSMARALVFEAHVLLAHAHAGLYEAGRDRLDHLRRVVLPNGLDYSCGNDDDDDHVRAGTQRARIGIQLCEAMLESQEAPRSAARTLRRVRYDLPRLTVDAATQDLVEQVHIESRLD